ncbi:MAG: FGGY family carbohydrate kinase [Gammaproteobacteria bacterium]|nr:FGGY family carbohydrate kinase [Gammaproteobacteria bacterium]
MQHDFLQKKNLYLAIDQGGHSSRALIFNHKGELISEGYAEVGVSRPRVDWVEQDPEELVQSILTATRQAVSAVDNRKQHICAAGMATQRSSIVCWDRNTGDALTPVLSWQDRRAHQWLEKFSDQSEAIHKITGLFLSAHYGASKLRWCTDHIEAVKDAARDGHLAYGPMASFLTFRLLRERPFVTDPANASRTICWNLKTRDWDPELLEVFGVLRSALPDCVPTYYDYGSLCIDDLTIPMKLVTGDQSAAIFALGELQAETAYINMGTGAFISRSLGDYPTQGRRLLTSVILQDDSQAIYALEGTVNGAGSALDWAAKEFELSTLFDHLPGWLEKSKSPPLFLNGVSGLGAPYWVPHFVSHFIGEGEDWERVVAVIESIIFLMEANLTQMQGLASPPQQIQLTGGLAKLDGLCQRLADLTELPVYRPREKEATARGTAYLLAGRPIDWPENEMGNWFKPKTNAGLKERYERWIDTLLNAIRKPENHLVA